MVLLGVLLTPVLVTIFTPGFEGEKREATIRLARIFFPGAGFLVLSAWCLGVLNSHGRFFLSYSAPVVWNLAIIGTLLAFGDTSAGYRLAQVAAWGSVLGSALQFGVQLPTVLQLLGRVTPSLRRGSGRGSDRASKLGSGLRGTGGGPDQLLHRYRDRELSADRRGRGHLLRSGALHPAGEPVRHVGLRGGAAGHVRGQRQRERARSTAAHAGSMPGCARSPSSSFRRPWRSWRLGDVVAGALYQTGAFTREMTVYVWAILAGSAIGLLASTWGRLYASTYYALQDTRTPLRFAMIRVALDDCAGIPVRHPLAGPARASIRAGEPPDSPRRPGWLAGSSFTCFGGGCSTAIGSTRVPFSFVARLWGGALAAAAAAWVVKLALEGHHPLVVALFSLGMYGAAYFAITAALGVPHAWRLLSRLGLGRH